MALQDETSSELSFEQALAELQRIASDLESGSLGLEESLARFEEGIAHLRKCHAILEQAEQRIEILTGSDAAGNPTFAPFDASATASSPGASAGRRPRKRAMKPEPPRVEPSSDAVASEVGTVVEQVVATSAPVLTPSVFPETNGPRLF